MMTDEVCRTQVRRRIQENISMGQRLLSDGLIREIGLVASILADAFKNGRKVLLFGNGGSAADAQHIAGELVGKYYRERSALPALALTVNSSSITAISNDDSFTHVFARQIEAYGNHGDVAIGISTSGNSVNVVEGLKEAKARGLTTVSFTGASGGTVGQIADHRILVPASDTPLVQEGHILIGHIICQIVEQELFCDNGDLPRQERPNGRRVDVVFLDRDGVINRKAQEGSYITNRDEFEFLPKAQDAIKVINRNGIKVIVVTNQRGIALGKMCEEDLLVIHQHMAEQLKSAGAHVDGIYYCPHDTGTCDCRKPDVGMFMKARDDFPSLDFAKAAVIGDSLVDMLAADRLGCTKVLIENTNGGSVESKDVERVKIDHVATSLWDATSWIVKQAVPREQ